VTSSEIITAVVGKEFTVRLQSNPSTGYVWDVQTLPNGITPAGSDFEKPAGSVRVGDSGTQVFRFEAKKPGQYTITFVLHRRWDGKDVESHIVTVNAA